MTEFLQKKFYQMCYEQSLFWSNMANIVYFWVIGLWSYKMGHVARKPAYGICEKQRRRSACACVQSDLCLCCSLPGWYYTTTCYIRNLKTLARPCSWAGLLESYLVANPADRFSRDEAPLIVMGSLYNGTLHYIKNPHNLYQSGTESVISFI